MKNILINPVPGEGFASASTSDGVVVCSPLFPGRNSQPGDLYVKVGELLDLGTATYFKKDSGGTVTEVPVSEDGVYGLSFSAWASGCGKWIPIKGLREVTITGLGEPFTASLRLYKNADEGSAETWLYSNLEVLSDGGFSILPGSPITYVSSSEGRYNSASETDLFRLYITRAKDKIVEPNPGFSYSGPETGSIPSPYNVLYSRLKPVDIAVPTTDTPVSWEEAGIKSGWFSKVALMFIDKRWAVSDSNVLLDGNVASEMSLYTRGGGERCVLFRRGASAVYVDEFTKTVRKTLPTA